MIGGGAGNALAILGLTAGTTQLTPPALSGQTLTIAATGGGTATSITFGTGAEQVSTLNSLNTALAANNLQATIDASTGEINIMTSNDAASSTIGAIGGTAATPVAFKASGRRGARWPTRTRRPRARAWWRSTTTCWRRSTPPRRTASFNGINLLNGDTLKLTFNETGKSTLSITGVTFNDAGLGLSTLTAGTDFLDNTSANKVADLADRRLHDAALGSLGARFEPVDRADPPGLLEEPDQRAADRLVQPDAGRHQRGSGQQPGAVDPPVDRGLGAGAGQPVAVERAAAAALSPAKKQTMAAGITPPPFSQFFQGSDGRRLVARLHARSDTLH